MSYSAIAFIAPNFRDYKNDWLKAYEPGTTTPKTMALDKNANTLVLKVQLNADGFMVSAGGALVIPYINGSYDLWLFPNVTDADNNDTSNAIRLADNIAADGSGSSKAPTFAEQIVTLTAGQTIVQFSGISTERANIFVGSETVDRGYLIKTKDYTILSEDSITLTKSFDAGTFCVAVSDLISAPAPIEYVRKYLVLDEPVNDAGLTINDTIDIKERISGGGGGAAWDAVLASSVTPDTYGVVQCIGVPSLALVLRPNNELNPYQFGCIGNGVADDTGAWTAWEAYVGRKTITPGSFLVSGAVKTYSTATYVNTTNTNHSAGYQALESNIDGVNNTAFGDLALSKNNGTSPEGSDNTAVGTEALKENTLGNRSTAVGYKSCATNQGGLLFGNSLTAVGYETLFNNFEGKDNTAIGYLSMFFNEGGSGNTGVGYRSLWSNTGTTVGPPGYAAVDGSFNVAVGYESMLSNNIGKSNTAVGWRSLFSNNIGFRNTCAGQEAMRSNVDGNNNTSYGYQSLYSSINGDDNVVVGYESLFTSTQPFRTVSIGRGSMMVSTVATDCVSIGYQSMFDNVGGIDNTSLGYRALSRNTSGNNITALGHQALEFTTIGGSNLAFDNCSGLGSGTRVSAANQVQLGDSATTTYAYGAVQDRSDMRDKLDVKDLTDAHIAFFMEVEWKQYRMNYREAYIEVVDGEVITHENDGSKAGVRYHTGAIAQQVEAAMNKHGIDFAGLQHHSVAGGEDIYSLGYQEFIAIQGLIIQKQQARLSSIEARLTAANI